MGIFKNLLFGKPSKEEVKSLSDDQLSDEIVGDNNILETIDEAMPYLDDNQREVWEKNYDDLNEEYGMKMNERINRKKGLW